MSETVTAGEGAMLLRVFPKHQQDKNLAVINAKLGDTGFWKEFPRESVEIICWYVRMGIGQVAILKLLAHRLRDLNLMLERCVWGALKTKFHPAYDFMPVLKGIKEKHGLKA
jgi:hypothetical protein